MERNNHRSKHYKTQDMWFSWLSQWILPSPGIRHFAAWRNVTEDGGSMSSHTLVNSYKATHCHNPEDGNLCEL
jgi:hypothetical protein